MVARWIGRTVLPTWRVTPVAAALAEPAVVSEAGTAPAAVGATAATYAASAAVIPPRSVEALARQRFAEPRVGRVGGKNQSQLRGLLFMRDRDYLRSDGA